MAITIQKYFEYLKAESAFVILVSFFVITNYLWIRSNNVPPTWDPAWYLENSQILYHTLIQKGVFSFFIGCTHIMQSKAPLIAILAVPFYILFGNHYTSALFVNLLFLVAGAWYLYAIVTLATSKKTISLLSVFFFNSFPLVLGLSRLFLVEYGLTTLVLAWIYYLMASSGLRNRSCAFRLGIILGFGLLMKISYVLYIFFPTCYILSMRIREDNEISKNLILNVIIITLIAFGVAGIWYVQNFATVFKTAWSSGYGKVGADYSMGSVFSLVTVINYWLAVILAGISFHYFIMFTFIFIFSIILKINTAPILSKKDFVYLLSWFLFPFLIFTFGVNKDIRFLAPLFPAIAIYLAIQLSRFSNYRKGKYLIIILLIYPLYYYLSFSFTAFANNTGYAFSPIKDKWPLEDIVRAINLDAKNLRIQSPKTTLIFEHQYLNHNNLSYFGQKNGFSLIFSAPLQYTNEPVRKIGDYAIHNSDFVLTKSGKFGADFLNKDNGDIMIIILRSHMFSKMQSFALPDGTDAVLYQKVHDRQ